jgi:hypothetical protein
MKMFYLSFPDSPKYLITPSESELLWAWLIIVLFYCAAITALKGNYKLALLGLLIPPLLVYGALSGAKEDSLWVRWQGRSLKPEERQDSDEPKHFVVD